MFEQILKDHMNRIMYHSEAKQLERVAIEVFEKFDELHQKAEAWDSLVAFTNTKLHKSEEVFSSDFDWLVNIVSYAKLSLELGERTKKQETEWNKVYSEICLSLDVDERVDKQNHLLEIFNSLEEIDVDEDFCGIFDLEVFRNLLDKHESESEIDKDKEEQVNDEIPSWAKYASQNPTDFYGLVHTNTKDEISTKREILDWSDYPEWINRVLYDLSSNEFKPYIQAECGNGRTILLIKEGDEWVDTKYATIEDYIKGRHIKTFSR